MRSSFEGFNKSYKILLILHGYSNFFGFMLMVHLRKDEPYERSNKLDALAAVVAVGLVITMCTARAASGSKEEAAGTPETSLQAYAAAGAASLEDLPEESQAVGAARAAAPAALGNVMEDGQGRAGSGPCGNGAFGYRRAAKRGSGLPIWLRWKRRRRWPRRR